MAVGNSFSITGCIERHVHYVPIAKTTKRNKALWMDEYCFKWDRAKYKIWNRYLNDKSKDNYLNYCIARNKASKAVIHAKKKYERSIAENVKETPRIFWSYVRN